MVALFAALGTMLALTAPYVMGKAIDQLTLGNLSGLFKLVLLMAIVYVLSTLAELTQGVLNGPYFTKGDAGNAGSTIRSYAEFCR